MLDTGRAAQGRDPLWPKRHSDLDLVDEGRGL